MKLKLFVVWGTEKLCTLLDAVPRFSFEDKRFYRHGCWGCYPLDLAGKSLRLDEKWEVGWWKESADYEHSEAGSNKVSEAQLEYLRNLPSVYCPTCRKYWSVAETPPYSVVHRIDGETHYLITSGGEQKEIE